MNEEEEMMDWFGCYSSRWQGEIVPEAFSHPAKFSRALIRRIYAHALERGYLREGQTVLDPFGGVALGALDAMFHGLHYIGCELEDKFVQLGQQNIDLWNKRYGNGMLPRWGTAVILQGDSRNLVEVLEGARAEGIIASPPFSNSQQVDNRTAPVLIEGSSWKKRQGSITVGTDPAQLGNMPTGEPPQAVIGSPPHSVAGLGHDAGHPRLDAAEDIRREAEGCGRRPAYGESDGQLAAMREGDVDAVIASPPWRSTEGSHSAAKFKDLEGSAERRAEGYRSGRLKGHGASKEAILRAMQKADQSTYGTSDGQLAALPGGKPPQIDGLVASPPYEASMTREEEAKDYPGGTQVTKRYQRSYGKNPDNLGNISQDTFWSAAKTILDQCYAVLAPGGVAIFVTKRFVRDKKIVDFSQQWADLCQSCGFELVEWIKAHLVEERGTKLELLTADTSATMHKLNGESKEVTGEIFEEGKRRKKIVKRFSFFRRLHAQKYPHLAIEWEDVLIFRKGAA